MAPYELLIILLFAVINCHGDDEFDDIQQRAYRIKQRLENMEYQLHNQYNKNDAKFNYDYDKLIEQREEEQLFGSVQEDNDYDDYDNEYNVYQNEYNVDDMNSCSFCKIQIV